MKRPRSIRRLLLAWAAIIVGCVIAVVVVLNVVVALTSGPSGPTSVDSHELSEFAVSQGQEDVDPHIDAAACPPGRFRVNATTDCIARRLPGYSTKRFEWLAVTLHRDEDGPYVSVRKLTPMRFCPTSAPCGPRSGAVPADWTDVSADRPSN